MNIKLSVNINKVALLRNARIGNIPDLVEFAMSCDRYGADGITVHPRPDQRHIRYSDLEPLKEVIATEFNIEGYPSDIFLKHVCRVIPDQCTLVPDPPGVLTSDSGWDIGANSSMLRDVITQLKELGIRVSVFVNSNIQSIEAAYDIGADRVELYTGDYAKYYASDRDNVILDHIQCSLRARELGIGVNAGHDLNLYNLAFYCLKIPFLEEVSIGHALISDALNYGISNTIGMYLNKLKN